MPEDSNVTDPDVICVTSITGKAWVRSALSLAPTSMGIISPSAEYPAAVLFKVVGIIFIEYSPGAAPVLSSKERVSMVELEESAGVHRAAAIIVPVEVLFTTSG